jgi:hypothetical protein
VSEDRRSEGPNRSDPVACCEGAVLASLGSCEKELVDCEGICEFGDWIKITLFPALASCSLNISRCSSVRYFNIVPIPKRPSWESQVLSDIPVDAALGSELISIDGGERTLAR